MHFLGNNKALSRLLTLLFFFLTSLSYKALSELPPAGGLSFSPSDVVLWKGMGANSYKDSYTAVKVFLETKENFGIYATKLKVHPPSGSFFSHLIAPITETAEDPMTKELTQVYRGGEFTFIFSNLLPHEASDFNFTVEYVGCSNKICLFPYKEKINTANFFSAESLPKELQNTGDLASPSETKKEKAEAPVGQEKEKTVPSQENKGQNRKETSLFSFTENSFQQKLHDKKSLSSFLFFLLFLLLAGVATNLTPCVYPMVPITIRILAKQETSPLLASIAYAIGIMLTYTTLALVAIASGSVFGNISSNVYMNLFLAAIMFYFGLSMLGYGNYSFLQRLGYKFSPKEHGLKTAFIMGAGAGLIASPCTGPILGSLLAYSSTASASSSMVVAYFITYSFGFSLPYIFLGRAASKLSKLQFKSSLQELTKILFSGVMFGLFFYYLRIPFYSFHKTLLLYWPPIALWSFIGFLVLYLISKKIELFGAFKIHSMILLGLFFFSSIQWKTQKVHSGELEWLTSESEAFQRAKETGNPIFIDFWAEWCEVCKKLDRTTFSDTVFVSYMKEKEWVLLRLDLTENNAQNKSIYKKYQVVGLPTLVFLSNPLRERELQLKGHITTTKLIEALESFSE